MKSVRALTVVLALSTGLGAIAGCHKSVKQDEAYEEPLTSAQQDSAQQEQGDTDADPSPDADSTAEAGDDTAKNSEASADSTDTPSSEKSPHQPAFEATGRVAVIDGETITAEAYNKQAEARGASMGGRKMPYRLAKMMAKRTLDRLIEEHLIDAQLAKADIEVDPDKVNAELDKFVDRFPTKKSFDAFLERNGQTLSGMKRNLRKDLQLRVLLEKKYGISVDDKDARAYYDSNPARFEKEEQVHARHILVKTSRGADKAELAEAKARAAEIAKKAKKPGADFAALAKKYSEGPSAKRGGDLGYFTAPRMVPEFSKAAFAMKPGDVSGPVKTQFGYHIIKVVDHQEPHKVPFEEAKPEIVNHLKRTKFRQAVKDYLAELKKNTSIKRFDDNIRINVEEGAGDRPEQLRLNKQLQKKLRERQK